MYMIRGSARNLAHTFAIILQLFVFRAGVAALSISMERHYNELASQLYEHLDGGSEDRQHWIAISGGPGSGKTTTAECIAERLNTKQPNSCVILPIDGFHYSKARLLELDPTGEFLRRRGAPWTFDAEKCVEDLSKARTAKSGLFPIYDRSLSDPVGDGVELKPEHRVVLVEGLYLLLAHDARWEPLQKLWDRRWFVKAPSLEIQRRRLIQRSLHTWLIEKAKIWGEGEIGAAARVDANDVLNMDIVASCEEYADTVIVTK